MRSLRRFEGLSLTETAVAPALTLPVMLLTNRVVATQVATRQVYFRSGSKHYDLLQGAPRNINQTRSSVSLQLRHL